jgi:hypothetical protein
MRPFLILSKAGDASRPLAIMLTLLTAPNALPAQSSADYKAWLSWCIQQGGMPNYNPNNPVCTPGTPGGGASSQHSAPTYSGPSSDELAREARERERREEARRQADEAERQRRFIADRDAAAGTLKGTGTPFFGATELKGAPPEGSGIRDIKPAAEARDLGGPQAAWKQLNCAASLSGTAFAALRRRTGPDYDEFSYLTREATNALNGDPLGVQCPAPSAMPKFEPSKFKIKFVLLLERMKSDAAELKRAQTERESNLDKLIEAKRKLFDLGGANPKAALEIADLEKQRQSLGPLTIKATAPPPPPAQSGGPSPTTAEDAKKSAMTEALAAAKAAEAAYDAATRIETATERELAKMGDIADKLEKGDASAGKLLDQMFAK